MTSFPELVFAADVADNARKIAHRYFRSALEVDDKEDHSPVTVADREIEAYLRSRIAETFPEHGIFGEEQDPVNMSAREVWVVDPIDGTKSFVTGHPLFGNLMALLRDGEPVLGQIDMPAFNERWQGMRGAPTTFNGTPCTASGCTELSKARAYTTDPELYTGADRAAYEALHRSVHLLRFGGDCYNYGLLASGHCDIVLEIGQQPYDYLPVVQVVEGAGGVITDWSGRPLGLDSKGDVLASATPELHEQMLKALAPCLAGA
ncbi:histidinol-phosphatase [Pseudooceanicola sp. CBS1P-1]|uniref:Histidinol-phosphatase n=1 Tax=Pseudooceanicola albus TaxID=2692189 RepID=A0A6L7G629_9RHOB|nr:MULTISPECIES: histidinol-phosphatase [Pseudooceanicola]MBT9385295.1 histidinol-phosphatase [Pseudooceanicola endophyticus]MXN18846.1 histidinol-phosphatase [Pseudooceanicola albus]